MNHHLTMMSGDHTDAVAAYFMTETTVAESGLSALVKQLLPLADTGRRMAHRSMWIRNLAISS